MFEAKELSPVVPSTGAAEEAGEEVARPRHVGPHTALYTYVDMEMFNLILSHPSTHQHIMVDLKTLPGWPGPAPLHTLALPDGKTIYITYMASAHEPAGIAVVEIVSADWTHHTATVKVLKDLRLDPPGMPSNQPSVSQVDPSQPIADWNRVPFTQVHGPTLLPGSDFAFFTIWTDSRIVTVNVKTHTLVSAFTLFGVTEQTHGLVFNDKGTRAIGNGYFYDLGLSLWSADKQTGKVEFLRKIPLGTDRKHGAYAHTSTWIDNRYAVTGSMQIGPTSLTPAGVTILGPSVFLIDTKKGTAKQIIGPTNDINGAGILRPASYVAVAKNKLFVAEEDSLDGSFGDDGFISVFDISDIHCPKFLKRFKPGVELPAGYSVAHAFSVTLDNKLVLVESYHSGYMVAIDVDTLAVDSVMGPADGLHMPHGGYVVGRMH